MKDSQFDLDDAPAGDHTTRHCFVLCGRADVGDLSAADEVAKRVFGTGYSADTSDTSIVSIMHGEKTVGFLAHMPLPIPGGEADDNAGGNFLWPNGKEEAAKHRSHVIVTSAGSGALSPVESALAVSRLALVALELFDGIGVYWGNACVCNSREIFEDFCEGLSTDQLPIPVWLRFQAVRADDDEIGIYTLGMDQFGLLNIEVDRCPLDLEDLFEFVTNIAYYLIQNGPVISHGDTVGEHEDQRILVQLQPSMTDEDRQVYKLVFETA